jgi:hypothetical protein
MESAELVQLMHGTRSQVNPGPPRHRYAWNPKILVAMESAEQAWTHSPALLKPGRELAAPSVKQASAAVGATCGRPHGYLMVRAAMPGTWALARRGRAAIPPPAGCLSGERASISRISFSPTLSVGSQIELSAGLSHCRAGASDGAHVGRTTCA